MILDINGGYILMNTNIDMEKLQEHAVKVFTTGFVSEGC